jgi:predicted PurR-regulated permease PerM
MDTELKESRDNRILVSLACIVIVIAGMREASSILVPFLLSVFIAVMCAGPFSWMRSKGIPAVIAILLIIAVILGAMFGVGAYIGASVSDFSQQLPVYQERIHDLLITVIIWLRSFGIHVSEKMLLQYFNPGSLMQIVANLLSSLGSALTYAFLILFIVVFILIEASSFSRKLALACGASLASLETIDRVMQSIEKYLALKTWISLATGILVMLLLTVLGVKYSLLWGLVAFLMNYIPNIGPFIAAIPPVLLSLVDSGLGTAGLVTLGYLVIKTVMGDIIEPIFMGRRLSLSMLVVFLSLIFWGWVLGPVGMLLSVPLTMILKIVCESFESTKWIAILLGSDVPMPEEALEKIEGDGADPA